MTKGLINIYIEGQRGCLSFWLPKVKNVEQYARYRFEKYFKSKYDKAQAVYLSVRNEKNQEIKNIRLDN